jgi:hypothetical protein
MLDISDVTPSMAFTLAETGGVATTFTDIVPDVLVSVINPIQTVNVQIGEGGFALDRSTIFYELGIYVGDQIPSLITYSEWLNGGVGYWTYWGANQTVIPPVTQTTTHYFRPWYPANITGFF